MPGGALTQTDRLPGCLPGALPQDLSAPKRHHFPVFIIHLSILWVVHGNVSLRAVCYILSTLLCLLGACFLLPASYIPCHESVRSWLFRVGLFLLRRSLPLCSDWALIVDATIRLGTRKCLVILAVHLSHLPRNGFSPALDDVLVLDLAVTEHCTGEFVDQRLQKVMQRTGPVKQVVRDHGSDLNKGVRLIKEKNPDLVDTYDVTHAMAGLVEDELESDPRWAEFIKGCSSCLPRLQQSVGAFLMPPTLRTKARYMNVDTHVEWARRILGMLDRQEVKVLANDLKVSAEQAVVWLEARLGWVRGFRDEVQKYSLIMEVVKVVQTEVKTNGLSRQTAQEVSALLPAAACADARLASFLNGVREYVKTEAEKIPVGQKWLGSSDVIESLFGKYKSLSEDMPFPEIGGNILSLPVITTPLTGDLIRTALETIRIADVREWVAENIGTSTFAKIKQVLISPDKPQVSPAFT
jgi:hypothetical protein